MNNPARLATLVLLGAAAQFGTISTPLITGAMAAPDNRRAQIEAVQPGLSAEIERYLNSITTMRSRFLQIAPSGDISRGIVLLSRPGQLRIEYDPPVPVLILTEGNWLMFYDKELEQPSYAPVRDTLAGFLIRKNIRLSDDDVDHKIFRGKGVVRVSITRREAPESGKLTLVFSNSPLRLRQWTITDGRGEETRVALEQPRFNGKIEAKEFEFTLPERENDNE
ncbi:MAG: outer membrane lipoprotein carrier protein LolA [Alphaproteobacteria bacterium]|nr:outer membrane lipoprotein carrier protein LolA [Alphaproteobacteria bacterium]